MSFVCIKDRCKIKDKVIHLLKTLLSFFSLNVIYVGMQRSSCNTLKYVWQNSVQNQVQNPQDVKLRLGDWGWGIEDDEEGILPEVSM